MVFVAFIVVSQSCGEGAMVMIKEYSIWSLPGDALQRFVKSGWVWMV